MAFYRHLPRIWTGSKVERHIPHIWNGSAWVEYPSKIVSDQTNLWLYNNGNEMSDINGGWISEGLPYLAEAPGTLRALDITKNVNSMSVTMLDADFGGEAGIARTAYDVDLTPYSVLRMKCDYVVGNCTACLIAMKRGAAYWGNSAARVHIPAYTSANGAEFAVDVSALTGNYDIGIGIIGWDSYNSITVYEIELR